MNTREPYEYKQIQTLDDQAYDLLGELLLEQETRALLTALETENAAGHAAPPDASSLRRDTKNLTQIDRYFRKRRARTFFRETLPKAGQAAAIVIAVLAVAGSVAVAASHTVRVQVMKLLARVETEYTELSLVENPEASFDVPAEWQGSYYPAYIPQGMEMTSLSCYPGLYNVDYAGSRDSGQRFSFSENEEGSVANVDTENAELQEISVNGASGILSRKDQTLLLYWDNGNVFFIISAENMEADAVLRIAESITLIR